MNEYFVSYMCIYSRKVEADCPEEAADIVANDCPYDIDGNAYVVDVNTGEEFEMYEI